MKKQAYNPYLPSWEYVPDGEPRVFGDRLYVYGSHDLFNGSDFCLGDYVCWSAPVCDLSDWRYEGVIYRKEQDPRNHDGKMHLCAPDCIKGPDRRYYIYYQLHLLKCTCVAVSDSPTGPFSYYGCVKHPDGTPWGEKKGDSFAFDPGVLIDDDGKIYLYIGNSPKPGIFKTILKLRQNRVEEAVCLELETDMLTVKGKEKPIVPGTSLAKGTPFEGHGFYEASSIRKVKGKYYFVYSSVLSHELCYAISDFPDKGFKYCGTIVSIADLGFKGNKIPLNYTGNTHGGMVQVNGQWYIFYHRQTNKIKCSRQGCAEKINILEDGKITQVETTSCGLNNGPLTGKGCYEARIACNLNARNGIISSPDARKKDKNNKYPYFTQSGADREGSGDQYIANLRDGAWCGFKYFMYDGSEEKIRIRYRGQGKGIMTVRTGLEENPVAVLITNPSEDWTDVIGMIKLSAGQRPLYFEYEGYGSIDFSEFEIL